MIWFAVCSIRLSLLVQGRSDRDRSRAVLTDRFFFIYVGAKSSKISRRILRDCVYRIGSFWYRLFVFLIIMPQPIPNIDRAACMWTSRHKNIRRRFAVGIFCRCSQLRRTYFTRRRVASPKLNTLCGLEPQVRRGMSEKDLLLACLSLNKAKKKTAQRAGEQADKNDSSFAVVCLSVRNSFEHAISG